jgi:hypothetical protein
MNDIAPSTTDRLLESLRERERELELEIRVLHGRLDEIHNLIGALTSRPRGRPRLAMRGVRGDEPLPPPAGLPDPPPEEAA